MKKPKLKGVYGRIYDILVELTDNGKKTVNMDQATAHFALRIGMHEGAFSGYLKTLVQTDIIAIEKNRIRLLKSEEEVKDESD